MSKYIFLISVFFLLVGCENKTEKDVEELRYYVGALEDRVARLAEERGESY